MLDLGGEPTAKPQEQEKKNNAFDFIHGQRKNNPEAAGAVELLGGEPTSNPTDNNLLAIDSVANNNSNQAVSQNPASKFKFINKGAAQQNPDVQLTQSVNLTQPPVQSNPSSQQKLDAFKMFGTKEEKKVQGVSIGSELMGLNFSEQTTNNNTSNQVQG